MDGLRRDGIERIVLSQFWSPQSIDALGRAQQTNFERRSTSKHGALDTALRVGRRTDLPYDWYAFCIPSRVVDLPRMRPDE
jgi:hypothetical protein